MKNLKFYQLFLFAFFFFCAGGVFAQPLNQSSLPRNVNALPSPNVCDQNDKKQSLIFVKGLGQYECIGGTYVKPGANVITGSTPRSGFLSIFNSDTTIGKSNVSLTNGRFSTGVLGSGTADSTTVLYGDGTWKTPPANAPPGATSALRFDRTKGHNVYAGQFWRTNAVYGEFFIDALVNPSAGAEYIFSAGYGAWHNILFGFNGGDGSTIALTGNVSSESPGNIPFTSVDSGVDRIPLGSWANIGLGYYNGYLTTYINGIPCKKFVKNDGRRSNQAFEVDAYIGGSDHSNFNGLIQWLRIFDNQNPIHRDYSSNEVYRPELRPRTVYAAPVANNFYRANLLLDFSAPSLIIDDKSDGFEGSRHSGVLNYQGGSAVLAESRSSQINLPQWESVTIAKPQTTLTPATVPAGALVFDSFNRNDVNYLWDETLGLGNTEGGSLGVQTWEDSGKYGIFNGRAYSASGGGAFPKVNVNTPYQKVSTTTVGNEATNVSLYVALDTATDSGIFGYHDAGGAFYFYKRTNGALAGLGSFMAGNTESYTVTIEYTPNRHIKLYKNGVLKADVDDSANPALTGTRAGFATTNAFNRIDNFTVQPSSN